MFNCIYCAREIVTIPGANFVPHYQKNGQFKCRQCGPFNRADMNVNSPFSTGANSVEFINGNGVGMSTLTDQQLASLVRHSV